MEMTDSFAVSDDAAAREVSGEMVLLNLESGMYFGLNDVGGCVWKAMGDAPAEVRQLCDAVEAQFDAPRDVIEADVAELIGQLLENELIIETAENAP